MPVFRQQVTINEDRYGAQLAEFIISDDYELLFDQTGIESTDIFDIGSIKKDLDRASGVQVINGIDFSMNAARILTAGDDGAFALALTADQGKLFVALFINPTSAGNIDDCDFYGLIDRKMSGTDLKWHGSEWTSSPDPVREWKFSAKSFGTAVLDELNLTDEVNEAGDTLSGLLNQLRADTTWMNANVLARKCHRATPGEKTVSVGGDVLSRDFYLHELINCGAFLERMAELASAEASARIGGTLTIEFDSSGHNCDTDFYAMPVTCEFDENIYPANHVSKIITRVQPNATFRRRINALSTSDSIGFAISRTAIEIESLNDDDTRNKWYSPQFGYHRYKSFMKMVYAMAYSLGMFVKIDTDTPSHIFISFVARNQVITGNTVYLRAPTDANLDASFTPDDKAEKNASHTTPVTSEGREQYTFKDGQAIQTDKAHAQNGEALAFGIGSTIADVPVHWHNRGRTDDALDVKYNAHILHNTYSHDYGIAANDAPELEDDNAISAPTNLIYMRITDGAFKDWEWDSIGGDAAWLGNMYRPIGAIDFPYDVSRRSFEGLADYVNYLNSVDGGYYEQEYTITVPWLSAFSYNSDGSAASWKSLKLGDSITLDGRTYLIIGLERAITAVKTTLRLQRVGRFSYGDESDPLEFPSSILDEGTESSSSGDGTVDTTIADGAIVKYEYVQVTDDGAAKKAENIEANYFRAWGIALGDAADGEDVAVQTDGYVTNDDWDWDVGPVYVRPVAGTLSQDIPVTIGIGTDETILKVALAVSPTTILLQTPEEFIL